MEDQAASETHHQHQDSAGSIDASECSDNDDRLKQTGTIWTASAHIITALFGSGVLSLPWAIAQLGWIAGPAAIFLFSCVTYYTLRTVCDRSGDPDTGNRNQTYMDAVRSTLGEFRATLYAWVQYLNLIGIAIGYSNASGISMMAIKRSNCFHENGDKNPCHTKSYPFMLAFGIVEMVFSLFLDLNNLWWLSIFVAVMSVTCSASVICLGIARVAENGKIMGSLTGISIGTVTSTQKIWTSFQAIGNIASAYSYSLILVEIQYTIRSPPSESETMKKACLMSVTVITLLYMLCGCMGYAAFEDSFEDSSHRNLLAGFGFYNPFWLLDIANAAIVVLLVVAYQVYCQPLFAFVENLAAKKYPNRKFVTKEIEIPLLGFQPYKLNLFRFVWRTLFVITTTIISVSLPFFNRVVGVYKALRFWPLTIYFPVEMCIKQHKIAKWSMLWLCLRILSIVCFIVTIAAAIGSIAGIVLDLKSSKS